MFLIAYCGGGGGGVGVGVDQMESTITYALFTFTLVSAQITKHAPLIYTLTLSTLLPSCMRVCVCAWRFAACVDELLLLHQEGAQ